MVNYFCHRCGKFFSHKGTFKRHLKKSEKCFPFVSDKKREEIWDYYHLDTTEEIGYFREDDMVMPEKTSQKPRKESKKDEKKVAYETLMKYICTVDEVLEDGKTKYRCIYCNSTFSRKNNAVSHIRKICRGVEKMLGYSISDSVSEQQFKNIKKQVNKLSKTGNVINYTNNVQNIHNNVNTNYIQLNAFGKEHIIKIPEETLEKAIKNPIKGIPDLISMHHFNPEDPKNNNVRYNGSRSFYVDVYNGDFWEAKDKGEVIHDMIVSKKDIADDYFDDVVEKNKVGNKVKDKYSTFSEKIDRYVNAIMNELNYGKELLELDKELYNQLYKQVELMMINAQRILTSRSKNAPSQFDTIE